MSRKPSITIGLPTYNAEKFLEETLDSLLEQTFQDFEIIISDNASTDRTESICQTYVARDSRIRYVRNEKNLGAAFNYNQTFELSVGEYFKWAAADDLCAPSYIEKCITALERRQEAVLCYSHTTLIDEYGTSLRQAKIGPDLDLPSVTDRFHRGVCNLSHCNAVLGVIRSDILRKTRLIQNYSPSDKVLLLELMLYGPFIELPEYLFFRRLHPAASGHVKTIEAQQEFYDPQTKGKIFLFAWNLLIQKLRVVREAPSSPLQKMHMLLSIARRMLTDRKRLLMEPIIGLMLLLGMKTTSKTQI
ncbi:glycosyltransferase family 2 protein [Nitrospira sp. M1]